MIKRRIRYIFKNFNKKLTIYDYIQEPVICIKKGEVYDVQYVARPVFNSIRVGENKKNTNSLCGYRRYKLKHRRSRMNNIEVQQIRG